MRKESSHAFSIELRSKEFLRNVLISNRMGEKVLIEGSLGELREISLVENAMFELRGGNGVLRIDLNAEELERLFGQLSHEDEMRASIPRICSDSNETGKGIGENE